MPRSAEEDQKMIEHLLREKAAELKIEITDMRWFAEAGAAPLYRLSVRSSTGRLPDRGFSANRLREGDMPKWRLRIVGKLVGRLIQLEPR